MEHIYNTNKVQYGMLYGHSEKSEVVITVMEINLARRIGRERLKKKWLNAIEDDLRTAGVYIDMGDRIKWKFITRVANPK